MTDLTRPEAAARLQRWLDGDQTYVPEDAIAAAVAYLREPAPGAAAIAERIIDAVQELPNRTSPDDAPEMMLVTAEELRVIVDRALPAPEVPR